MNGPGDEQGLRVRAQVAAFDALATRARFSHPLDAALLARHLARHEAVLDLGCGYGRLTAELVELGWRRAVGVDASEALLRRGREQHAGLDLRPADARALPFGDGGFGAVLAFALFTSLPAPEAQGRVLDEIERVLRPGGHLLVSDLPLQADRRNQARYRRDHGRAPVWGTFELSPGFWMRHHDEPWFDRLAERFEQVDRRELEVRTLGGHRAVARQVLLRRSS